MTTNNQAALIAAAIVYAGAGGPRHADDLDQGRNALAHLARGSDLTGLAVEFADLLGGWDEDDADAEGRNGPRHAQIGVSGVSPSVPSATAGSVAP